MAKKFEFDDQINRHQCDSWPEGGWIIFRCPASGFSRKMNTQNGDLVLLEPSDTKVLHSGYHQPVDPGQFPLMGN